MLVVLLAALVGAAALPTSSVPPANARAQDPAPQEPGDGSARRELQRTYHYPPPPPWFPGAAPPIPGPVFSNAFNALLVLMVLGCGYFCVTLKQGLQKFQNSDLGEDNEVLTKGDKQKQEWLKNIAAKGGMTAGITPSEDDSTGFGKPKKKKKEKEGKEGKEKEPKRSSRDRGDDEKPRRSRRDESEMADLKPKSSSRSKESRTSRR